MVRLGAFSKDEYLTNDSVVKGVVSRKGLGDSVTRNIQELGFRFSNGSSSSWRLRISRM
jgi:hypothetical protein